MNYKRDDKVFREKIQKRAAELRRAELEKRLAAIMETLATAPPAS